jgi:hypothetical protein
MTARISGSTRRVALIQRSGRLGAVPLVGTLRGSHQWVRFDGGPDYSESSSGTAGLQAG